MSACPRILATAGRPSRPSTLSSLANPSLAWDHDRLDALERQAFERFTEDQLFAELGDAGFAPDPAVPLTEYNRPPAASLHRGRGPVSYEAAFGRVGLG